MSAQEITHFIKSIEFEREWALWLIPFLLVLFITIFVFRSKTEGKVVLSNTLPVADMRKTWRIRIYGMPLFLRFLALLFLVIVIAGPYTRYSLQRQIVEGIDIMICLDVSGSMLAQDFKPDRLSVAKEQAIKFVQKRYNDRIGFVIFSRDAVTVCPLTTDHSALINLINKVEYGSIEDGTAIGLGLALSAYRLKNSDAKSKVIILLTDGVNNAGEISPEEALEIVKSLGIRCYTIGIGTLGEAPMPFKTPWGIQYRPMKVEIDEALLKKIAEETGGHYFRATDARKLEAIYNEINNLEKTKIESTQYNRKTELFYIPLSAVLLILIAEIFIRTFVIGSPVKW